MKNQTDITNPFKQLKDNLGVKDSELNENKSKDIVNLFIAIVLDEGDKDQMKDLIDLSLGLTLLMKI